MRTIELKKAILLACGFLLSLGCESVAAQTLVKPISLVPPNTVAVAKLNWAVIRQDDRFRTMLNTDQLDRELSKLNIDANEVSEIIIFSGMNSSPTGHFGGIFSGTYSAPAVTAKLKAQGLAEDSYKRRTIYTDQRDQSCTSILRSGMLVIGSRNGVEGVIDVETNPRLSVTSKPPFRTLLGRFAVSRQPISFMMSLPLEYQAVADVATKVVSTMFSMAGLGPLGYVVDKIGVPHVLGFSIGRSGATFPTELIAQMKDDYSAALISGTLNIAQTINLNMLSDRMSAPDREMLKNISVTRTGPVLSVKLALREQDLPPPMQR